MVARGRAAGSEATGDRDAAGATPGAADHRRRHRQIEAMALVPLPGRPPRGADVVERADHGEDGAARHQGSGAVARIVVVAVVDRAAEQADRTDGEADTA